MTSAEITALFSTLNDTYTEIANAPTYDRGFYEKVAKYLHDVLQGIETVGADTASSEESIRTLAASVDESLKATLLSASSLALNTAENANLAQTIAQSLHNLSVEYSVGAVADVTYDNEANKLSFVLEKGDPFAYSDFTPEQIAALKGAKGDTGDKGDPFAYSDFTPEQIAALKVKGDTGDKGDPFAYSDFTPEQIEALKVKGDTGATAYEIAVAGGFSGTEAEWLLSLKGADGNGAGDMLKSVYDPDGDGKVVSALNADNVPWGGVGGKPTAFPPETHTHPYLAPTDVIDTLTSVETAKPLSAAQGKALKGLVDNLAVMLSSDDTTLDEIQEIVNFIKLNKTTLDALGISNIAGLEDALAGKSPVSHTHELKTINGQSIVGVGNIEITANASIDATTMALIYAAL